MKKIILGLISLFLSIPNFADAQNKNCTDEVSREVDFFLIRQEKVYYPSFTDYKGKIHSPDTHIEFSFKNPTNKKIKITYIGLKTKDNNEMAGEKHNLIMQPYTQYHKIGLAKKNLMLDIVGSSFFRCEYTS